MWCDLILNNRVIIAYYSCICSSCGTTWTNSCICDVLNAFIIQVKSHEAISEATPKHLPDLQEFFTSGSAGSQWVPSSTERDILGFDLCISFGAGERGNFECVKWSLTVRTFTLSQNQSLRTGTLNQKLSSEIWLLKAQLNMSQLRRPGHQDTRKIIQTCVKGNHP